MERDYGKIATIIGDVSGKGIAAALFMVMGRTMIRDGLYNEDSPAKVLKEVNDKLCDANPEGMFVTVTVSVLDPSTGKVVLANAGHMPPMRIGARSEYLDVDTGVLMGLFEEAPSHKEFEELDNGGMGIGLIKQIAESAEYKRDGSDNVLLLRFELS